eukprot:CAMPEP_0172824650 /NCGR_PEP_ID=MMETSP1075-20121228/18142_1 /TAXON_ID=2916 /ORGANISM="Ceratium fusus, Strain PA161109" /LENGTH=729 /DNA_ID=CAMNT_0013665961 /DNA_START=52 /DNA_END=2238 /DNA_ORIENTATION=-
MGDGTDIDAPSHAASLEAAERHVKEMEDLEDYYAGADKDNKLAEVASAVEASLDRATEILDGAQLLELKSRVLYLRGRATSFLAGQERAAETLLSKAIKLDPQLREAWNGLGEVYWNLKDVAQAKQCFEQALDLCGPNPISLRNLSMALRALNCNEQQTRAENYSKALAKAKEAVALCADDPLSWETLGNAYVGDFIVNARRPDEVNRALIAYEKAETAYERLGKQNHSLYFNRGMAAKYVEDYQLALKSFETAHGLGSTAAADEARKVLELTQRLAGVVERKNGLKARRLKELTADMQMQGTGCRTIQEMQAGTNGQAPVVARVISIVDRNDEVPVIVVCCDALSEFFALALYNAGMQRLADTLAPMETLVRIQKPRLRLVSVSDPHGKTWNYPCLSVGHPAEVLLADGSTLAATAVESVVFSTGVGRAPPEKAEKGRAPPANNKVVTATSSVTLVECQRRLQQVAKEAGVSGRGRAAVIEAMTPFVRALVGSELGADAGGRLGRIETMFARIGRGEVHTEDSEQHGKRYAPGYVEGLSPNMPFHDAQALPWCHQLKQHWTDIRDELRAHLHDSGVWVPGAYADSNKAYAPDWKIAGVLTADKWQAPKRWRRTQSIIKQLPDVLPFEVFFARMPPHSTIAAHSDNLNYIMTSHLALELEAGGCSILVGNEERDWEEGEMLVFDTSYIHKCWNDSDRNRYVLVFRFWHPDLTLEERRAIHFSHSLLAST